MSTIIENIKTYFSKKEKGEKTGLAPKGMCPPCWGYNEWDGHYYEDMKLILGTLRYQSLK